MAEVEKKTENLVYAKPKLITDNVMHYCPGCSHGTVHKLIAEVIEEMGLAEKTVGISPVGCSVFAYNYIDIDWIEAAHGRALAVATAVKRLYPQNMVFTYQGTMNMRNKKWEKDFSPVDPDGCDIDLVTTKAYLHHLFKAQELLARLATAPRGVLLRLRLVTDARHHIEQGDFVAWKNSIIDQLGRRI